MKSIVKLLRRYVNKAVIIQFVKFGLVGVVNTCLSLLVYYVCTFGVGLHYILSNSLGYGASIVSAFLLNRSLVFQSSHKGTLRSFLRTVAIYVGTFLLSNILLVLQVKYLGVPQWLAPVFNLCITVPVNFLLSKFWAFKPQV